MAWLSGHLKFPAWAIILLGVMLVAFAATLGWRLSGRVQSVSYWEDAHPF
ncbi:hypothetical protein [Singulisphaera acidiphila]|nr:hypothetical protein [Singulisphaera acidiphila]